MGISAARTAAHDMREQVFQGADPNADKREEAKAAQEEARQQVSLKDMLDTYEDAVLKDHRKGKATRRALDGSHGLLTSLTARTVKSIARVELSDLIKAHAKVAPIAANRKLAYASAFFNWCIDEGALETNPIERMRKPSKERERDRFHTLAELKEIWAAAGTLGYPFQQLYRLLVALPMRREELAGMPLSDLTLGEEPSDDDVWLLPRSRTKKANALRVPLSSLARSIIIEARDHEERPKGSRFLFTTTTETSVSGFAKAKRRLDKAIQDARTEAAGEAGEAGEPGEPDEMPHWTLHDLRTTFNTHGCEVLGISPHVADRILNHVATATRSKIMRVYNKSELFEPRREALNAWAALLEERIIVQT